MSAEKVIGIPEVSYGLVSHPDGLVTLAMMELRKEHRSSRSRTVKSVRFLRNRLARQAATRKCNSEMQSLL